MHAACFLRKAGGRLHTRLSVCQWQGAAGIQPQRAEHQQEQPSAHNAVHTLHSSLSTVEPQDPGFVQQQQQRPLQLTCSCDSRANAGRVQL